MRNVGGGESSLAFLDRGEGMGMNEDPTDKKRLGQRRLEEPRTELKDTFERSGRKASTFYLGTGNLSSRRDSKLL